MTDRHIYIRSHQSRLNDAGLNDDLKTACFICEKHIKELFYGTDNWYELKQQYRELWESFQDLIRQIKEANNEQN